MKFNKKTIIGALAGLGLLGWAGYNACKKNKGEGQSDEDVENNNEIEVDYVDDVEVEA